MCIFVNDDAGAETIGRLAELGVPAIALRCAGYNNVDLDAAAAAGIAVVRVPAYSPEAVAEHTLALILALDRHIHRAYQRVRDGNFALDGLLGNGLHGATAGVVGTGRIGHLVARLLIAFGCEVARPRSRRRRAARRGRGRLRHPVGAARSAATSSPSPAR